MPEFNLAERLRDGARIDELRNTYTASELAMMLAANEKLLATYRDKLRVYQGGLIEIMSGTWTAAGCVDIARRAYTASSASTSPGGSTDA